jgi:hypothetical protein
MLIPAPANSVESANCNLAYVQLARRRRRRLALLLHGQRVLTENADAGPVSADHGGDQLAIVEDFKDSGAVEHQFLQFCGLLLRRIVMPPLSRQNNPNEQF